MYFKFSQYIKYFTVSLIFFFCQSVFAIEDVGQRITDRELKALISNIPRRWSPVNSYTRPFRRPSNYSHPRFKQPEVVYSNSNGELIHVLNVGYSQHAFQTFKDNGDFIKELNLRSYNGGMTGPTLVVRPGDTIRIKLVNNLPVEDHRRHSMGGHGGHSMEGHGGHCDENGHCDHNTPHNFNVTNLHTHGLHVDPTGDSDNVFLRVMPGEEFDYTIHIPEDHVAGTFWYHAHVHGSTTVQVGSGMHGAIIVRGDVDRLKRIRRAKDRVMLLQHISFDENGEIGDNENYFVGKWHNEGPSRGWHTSVNGQVMPQLRLKPGKLERWRFIHAGVREPMNLRLINSCKNQPDIPLVQIAADGIPFKGKRLSSDWGTFLAPGYRSDVLVKAVQRGVYYLVDASVEGATDLPDSYCAETRGDMPFTLDESAQNIIARVVVRGKRKNHRYPLNRDLRVLNRPHPIQDKELSDKVEYAEFNIVPKPGVNPGNPDEFVGGNFEFLINGRSYNPDYQRYLKLNTAQTWYLSSKFVDHPYHIHVNPFEVIKRNQKGHIVDRYWRDTVLVKQAIPPMQPEDEVVEIRTRYENFSGSFVLHCHILDHEDRGMMEKVTILP